MSIGGNCYSAAQEEALLKAFYNGLYLVGAAGNENADIYTPDELCIRKHCFPGAFKFVIGVMATDDKGNKAGFSNFDEDGPYYSEYDPAGPAFFGDYYNYDFAAPGSGILSTFLGGTYTTMSGTSMSTPLVAGALSRLLQCRTFYSQESCQGVLIQTLDSNSFHNFDVKAAM
jgi:subtilisin family serine protease